MTIGIYCIKNLINNKVYIGKSINIEVRIQRHFYCLRKEVRDKKQTNRYLFDSFKKYGEGNFIWFILETFEEVNDGLLADREIYFMDLFNSCNRDFGYNLRRDSSTKTEVHEDTRKLISENNRGDKNPNFGNKWTQEQKDRMSRIKKNRVQKTLVMTTLEVQSIRNSYLNCRLKGGKMKIRKQKWRKPYQFPNQLLDFTSIIKLQKSL